MTDPLRLDWLQDWDRQGVRAERQADYVRRELLRLQEEGAPLLYAALTLPFDEQRDVALQQLVGVAPVVALRLVAGARPPPLDPQGRPVRPEHAGKLVAKVGQVGQMPQAQIKHADDSGETRRYTASGMQHIDAGREGRYRTVAIGTEPVSLPLEHAIAVMRAWGHGVRALRYRHAGTDKEQDCWLLVEDCPRTRTAFPLPAARPEPKGPKAAPSAATP